MLMNGRRGSFLMRTTVALGVAMWGISGAITGNAEDLPTLPDSVMEWLVANGLGEKPFAVIGINAQGKTVMFLPPNVTVVDQVPPIKLDKDTNLSGPEGGSDMNFLRVLGSDEVFVCHRPPIGGCACCALQQK
jgi:hypothetical protein